MVITQYSVVGRQQSNYRLVLDVFRRSPIILQSWDYEDLAIELDK